MSSVVQYSVKAGSFLPSYVLLCFVFVIMKLLLCALYLFVHVSEALQLVMTAAGHSNEARRKIVSNCKSVIVRFPSSVYALKCTCE